MNKSICIFVSTLFLFVTSVFADIERVSVSTSGVAHSGLTPSVSADGRFVAFHSYSRTLVDDNTVRSAAVFVHDRDTGITEQVSVSTAGVKSNGFSGRAVISADGRFVMFSSSANNLEDTPTDYARLGTFVHDRDTGITERLRVSTLGTSGPNSFSGLGTMSANSRFVAFRSGLTNLVPGDTNNAVDVFVHDRDNETTERVSVSSAGVQANQDFTTPEADEYPSLSADGRFVVFSSDASNLVEGDTNDARDIFLHDRNTGTTERVSVSTTGVQSNGRSFYPRISADGNLIAYYSDSNNLVPGDINEITDIFVHDRNTGITERLFASMTETTGLTGNYGRLLYSTNLSLSADGRYVSFASTSSKLVDGVSNNTVDVFVHDRSTGITDVQSLSSRRLMGDGRSVHPSLSADGRYLAFDSSATNFLEGDTSNVGGVFITEVKLLSQSDYLSVTIRPGPNPGAVQIGSERIELLAILTNNTNQALTNCQVNIANFNVLKNNSNVSVPQFNFFSWPLNVNNPSLNGSIDIAAGRSGKIQLFIKPRLAFRGEVKFGYSCDSTRAYTLPYINTFHMNAKSEPIIAEDQIALTNGSNRTELNIDRNNGKYWTSYVIKVKNTGTELTQTKLAVSSSLGASHRDAPLRYKICEPADPFGGTNWSCSNGGGTEISVDMAPGVTKRIVVYVHANEIIPENPVSNRLYVEAQDSAGEIVANSSIGVSTLN